MLYMTTVSSLFKISYLKYALFGEILFNDIV